MDDKRAEEIRTRLMWDHDSEPNKLTEALDELEKLQETQGSPEELLERYREASSVTLDFFSRLREHAISEADSGGNLVDFSDSTASQIILACVRGYPDYRRAFEGTNELLNEEAKKSRKLEQQIWEIVQGRE